MELSHIEIPVRVKHLADNLDALHDVAFSNAVISLGLSSSSMFTESSLSLSFLGCSCGITFLRSSLALVWVDLDFSCRDRESVYH